MRVDRWEAKLSALVEEMRDVPFSWGTNDCATFAAAAVERITDKTISLGTWSSEEDAQAEIEARGGLIQAVSRVLGEPLRHPGWAQRGDVCLVRWSVAGVEETCLSVCVGVHVVAPGPTCLRFVPRRFVVMAWAVGRHHA